MLDTLPAAVFVKDSQSRIVFMNRACEEQWGMSLQQLAGSDGSQFFPAEQMTLFLSKDREVFACGQQIELQEAIWNAQRQESRMGHTFKRPVFDASGQPLYLLGVTLDVTERMSVEARLRASDEKLRRLYEMSPVGIALTDMQGRYIEFNHAFEQICGYSCAELNLLDDGALTPREYEAQELEQKRSIAVHGRYGPCEREYIRKDGSRIPVRLNGVVVEGGQGQRWLWSIVEDISERKQKDELIWRQANYDLLTDLPNRQLFRDRLHHAISKARRGGGKVALLLINLDRFKAINDSFGHDRGDQLLREVAHRLQDCVDDGATVARLGGNEFAAILTGEHEVSEVERIARHMLEQLHAPFALGQEQGYLSASIGITVFPDDASELNTLLMHAEHALQLAKRQGRDRFAYFTESMQRQAEEKRRLGADLRRALERRELVVYYQPIVEAANGRIAKAEALLRWLHPVRGLVGPAEFIPLAEESGLIVDIGDWVLREAITTARRWQTALGRSIEISVNMSALQFAEGSASAGWLRTLEDMQPQPHCVTLEITESLLLQDSASIKHRLLQLRTLGIEVSIDDFGTGFSALSYLKKFDIDYLKIDRAFTSGLLDDPSDRALTEAIIVMAHKLGIATIAEGVETTAQRDILQQLGCDYLQGFLFSRAVPDADFAALLCAEHPMLT